MLLVTAAYTSPGFTQIFFCVQIGASEQGEEAVLTKELWVKEHLMAPLHPGRCEV